MKPFFGGLAALLPSDSRKTPIGDLNAYNGWHNPAVTGFRLRLTHGKICPTETSRNWAVLDQAVNLAHSNGKRLSLSVAAGFSVGTWVYAKGVQKYTNADGSGTQPVPWDAKWQSIWFSFLDELAAHVPIIGTTRLSIESDPAMAEIIPCGFMTAVGMQLGSATDEAQMPHVGFADVDTAYVDAAEKILTHYQASFPTTPLEITYVAPFPTDSGKAAGLTVKNWFAATYPTQGGFMISSVFAVSNPPPPPDPSAYPHGGQCYQPVFHNSNQAGLYLPPVPNPIPPYPQPFIDTVGNAVSRGMQKLECYQGDLINVNAETLAEAAASLKSNLITPKCS